MGIDDGEMRAERDKLESPDEVTVGSGDCDETRLELIDLVGSELRETESEFCALVDQDGDFEDDVLARGDMLAVDAADELLVELDVCDCSTLVAVDSALGSAERETEGDAVPEALTDVELVADFDEINVADDVTVGDAVPVTDGVRDGELDGVDVREDDGEPDEDRVGESDDDGDGVVEPDGVPDGVSLNEDPADGV